MKNPKKLLFLLPLLFVSFLLVSCGGSCAYDPLLKYEDAGYSVTRVGGPDSILPSDYLLYEENLSDRCSNYNYYIELVTNSNIIEQLKIMDQTSSNLRFGYTNKMIADVHLSLDHRWFARNMIPLSNRVLVMDRSGKLYEFGAQTQNVFITNIVKDYSNSIVSYPGSPDRPVNVRTEENVYGIVRSVSPKGKYLLLEVPIVWKGVVSYDEGKGDIWDNGCAIVNTENYQVTYLYDTSQLTTYGGGEIAFLDISLKYIYIRPLLLPFTGKNEGGRTSDELEGWWKLDISSLGLSE